MTRRLFALLTLLTALFLVASFATEHIGFSPSERTFASSKKNVDVVYFYGEGCPHCAKVEPFIRELEQKYEVRIEGYEIYSNRSNMKLMQGHFDRYDVPMNRRGVPAVFTSNSYIVGDADILQGLESTLSSSVNAVSTQVGLSSSSVSKKIENEGFDCLSFITVTAAALVDSINPCSISILFFLLAGLLLLRNRKKALRIGLVFVLSAFVANLLFGLGIFSVIALSGLSSALRFAAGFIAVLVGGLLIKDYFFYGKGGFVMEVPRSLRPCLKHKLSRAFFGKSSLVSVFLIGFLVTSFEVPCTGGPYFYVLARMADETTRMQTIPLLLYYNLIFVMPLILITALLYLGSIHVEKAREWSDRNKRLVSLIRGLPMIAIGFVTIPIQEMLQVLTAILTIYRVVFIPVAAILLSYVACQAFSRSENKSRALRLARIGSLTMILVMAAVYAQTERACASWLNAVNDPGFEAGSPWPSWEQYSTNFGTPITDEASCGPESWCSPHTGTYWTYFGGIAAYELGWIRQTVIIPADATSLTFYLMIPKCAGWGSDYFRVYIDGIKVFEETINSPRCDVTSYQFMAINIASYADGGSHALEFRSETLGQGPAGDKITSFFVDDITIKYYIPISVTISSPKNNTSYYKTHVPLNFTVDTRVSYAGYSLDKEPEIDITQNTTWNGTHTNGHYELEDIIDGSHNITVFANATSGERGSSDTTHFYYCLGDLTGPTAWVPDRKIDIRDLYNIAHNFGAVRGDGKYDSRNDINDDGKIDISELEAAANQFGKNC